MKDYAGADRDAGVPLYQRALGEAFQALPAVLRRFHAASGSATATGVFRIQRGRGWLRHAVVAVMRLPAAGERVPVRLEVAAAGHGERWTRDFGPHRLVTDQWVADGLLMEAAGPLRFGFRLRAVAAGLRFEFVRCWLLGCALPTVLSPRVRACVLGREGGWWVEVVVEAPLLGMLAMYEGEMTPL